MKNELNMLSKKLLLQVKLNKNTAELQANLEVLNIFDFEESLTNDDFKKAFWINIYNAFYQILRIEKKAQKPAIYRKRLIKIARKKISLDDIEHGILRRNKFKYAFGFLPNLRTSNFVKQNMVKKLDYRIHFALNCGAKSCPPIAFYKVENIDQQLNLATQSFLESETIFNDKEKVVTTTALFKWFYADFGGNTGIKEIFKDQLNKDITDYKIIYNEYSWEDALGNFV